MTTYVLLRNKYLGDDGFFSYHRSNGSQFWKSLQEVKNSFWRGLKYVIGNGTKARLWHDTWVEGCPLKISFPRLFEICNHQEASIFSAIGEGDFNITFKRNFGEKRQNGRNSLTH
jgi:hypothetical protein